MIAGSGALAQDSKPAAAPAPVPAPVVEKPAPAQPVWTDEVLGKIGDMLAGTWKTEKPVQEVGGGASIDIVMAVTPVAISGLPNALYVESARADQLVEGAETIRIRGDTVVVRAQVHTLNGFSGHAGQAELLSWATAVKGASPAKTPPKFILTHGEDMPRETLANKLTGIFGATPNRPKWGEKIDLNAM